MMGTYDWESIMGAETDERGVFLKVYESLKIRNKIIHLHNVTQNTKSIVNRPQNRTLWCKLVKRIVDIQQS